MPRPITAPTKAITSRVADLIADILAKDPKANQKTFAQAIDAHPVVVSRWMKGQSSCTLDDVSRICSRYRVNPTWLIMGTGSRYLVSGTETEQVKLEMQVADMNIRLSALEIEAGKRKNGARKK